MRTETFSGMGHAKRHNPDSEHTRLLSHLLTRKTVNGYFIVWFQPTWDQPSPIILTPTSAR